MQIVRHMRVTGRVQLTLIFVLVASLLSVPAGASEIETGSEDSRPFVLSGTQVSLAADQQDGRSLWLWPEGDRGFVLGEYSHTVQGYQSVAGYDLSTGTEIGRAKLSPVFGGPGAYGEISLQSATVDRTNGRLFLPYSAAVRDAQRGSICPSGKLCAAGFHVLNGQTMEIERSFPMDQITVDGAVLNPLIRATEYLEPGEYPGADSGKLLLMVEDVTGSPVIQDQNMQREKFNLVYLVQIDAESGKRDWTLRVDGCRGVREQPGNWVGYIPVPNPSVLFRGSDPANPALYAGCYGGGQVGTVVRVPLNSRGVPATLPVEADPSLPQFDPDEPAPPAAPVAPSAAPQVYPGPGKVVSMLADPESERIAMKVIDGVPQAEVWWVFDGRQSAFIGTIGIGPYARFDTNSALDRRTGRLYVLAPKTPGEEKLPGGMYVTDLRQTPIAQALHFPEMASLLDERSTYNSHIAMVVAASTKEGQAPRLFVRGQQVPVAGQAAPPPHSAYKIVEDHLPETEAVPAPQHEGRTLDLEEVEGVTSSTLDGAARGYGLRLLLVGGADTVARAGPVDVTEAVLKVRDTMAAETYRPVGLQDLRTRCQETDRELILGAIGPEQPVVLDSAGARASARPIDMDSSVASDMEAPISRCAPRDWASLWAAGLFGKPPVDEPQGPVIEDSTAQCISSGTEPSGAWGDALGRFAARVECGTEDASGWSYARGAHLEGLTVAESLSSFRIYRDPARGVVSRVEAITRGVDIEGKVRISAIRGVAESWANGRRQPVAEADREAGYDANCDMERTAGTCFQRHLFGVRTPGYSCGPCGDEARAVDAMSRSLGANGSVRLREPDPGLARGSENGFIAAVQKPDSERFGDLVLNNDLLQTVVPTLEVLRFAPAGTITGQGGRKGRQIIQFAGVEVSSSYGIACLLVYDEAANTCAAPAEAPGSIQVTLSDTEGKPLAGGGFEVRADVDADGVLGLKDTLLPDGACVTADDGVGTCSFENLQPGAYLVSQVAAPPGYAKSAEPWVSEVASGEQRTVAFTNVSNVSTIDLKATDEHGAPISGATFAAYPDPDSDGKVAPDAKPAAECTTDAQGVCTMKVPAGSYVLVQTSAPGGLEGIEPVPFTFASGGQVASVSVVNYPPAAPEQPAPAAAPVDYTPPVDYAPPVESVTDFTPVADAPVVEEPAVSVPERIGGTVTQVIRAPGDALRLLARDPKQAVAWTAALALFCLAAMAVRRRQQAMALLDS